MLETIRWTKVEGEHLEAQADAHVNYYIQHLSHLHTFFCLGFALHLANQWKQSTEPSGTGAESNLTTGR